MKFNEQVTDINNDLENIFKNGNTEIDVNNLKHVFMLFVLCKALKTHGAIFFLSRSGFGEDSVVLTRSLFELMVDALYILNDGTGKRLKRYINYDWIERKKMSDYALSNEQINNILGEKEIASETIVEIEEIYDEIKDDYKNMGWGDKNIEKRAKEVGRWDNYKTVYKIACQFSHSSPRSMNNYLEENNDKLILLYEPSDNYCKESLLSSFDFLIDIFQKANEIFNWGVDDKLKNIEKRTLNIFKEVIDI